MTSRWIKRFTQDERGSATIESLLWFPLFVYLLLLITDVSFIFYGKAQALRIVQDGNRALSIRYPGITTKEAAQSHIRTQLLAFDSNPTVLTTIDNTTGLIETKAKISAAELMAIGAIPGFGDFEFEVIAQHFQEQ